VELLERAWCCDIDLVKLDICVFAEDFFEDRGAGKVDACDVIECGCCQLKKTPIASANLDDGACIEFCEDGQIVDQPVVGLIVDVVGVELLVSLLKVVGVDGGHCASIGRSVSRAAERWMFIAGNADEPMVAK